MKYQRERLVEMLRLHEGEKFFPYRCTEGFLTIGVGRNLDAKGIRPSESKFMLENDIREIDDRIYVAIPVFDSLTPNRQLVLMDMAFNLGMAGLLKFRKMLSALAAGEYTEASKQMLDSKWATQVGARAVRLAEMMRDG
jgi:lysozyme